MPKILVGETTIDFPNTGKDPTWSDSIIQFAEATAEQLSTISSNYDVPPLVLQLENNATNTVTITKANFNSEDVAGFNFSYTIFRKTDTVNASESGTILGFYNGSSWLIQREFQGARKPTSGESYHSFNITAQGQIELIYDSISGANYDADSRISYSAKTVLTSNVTE